MFATPVTAKEPAVGTTSAAFAYELLVVSFVVGTPISIESNEPNPVIAVSVEPV